MHGDAPCNVACNHLKSMEVALNFLRCNLSGSSPETLTPASYTKLHNWTAFTTVAEKGYSFWIGHFQSRISKI